jgi:hypothetical protein
MMLSRREFGKLTLASLPAATVLGGSDFFATAFAQGKPNSKIEGVQIGTITYSYRSMPDQSAEATLRYILDSGISAIELMGGPIESFAGIPTMEGGRGGGRGAGGPEGRGGRGERGAAPAELPPGARRGSWNGTECVIPAPGAARGGGGRGRGEATPEQRPRSRSRPPG